MEIQWTHSIVFITIVGARVCSVDRVMEKKLEFLKVLYFQEGRIIYHWVGHIQVALKKDKGNRRENLLQEHVE